MRVEIQYSYIRGLNIRKLFNFMLYRGEPLLPVHVPLYETEYMLIIMVTLKNAIVEISVFGTELSTSTHSV